LQRSSSSRPGNRFEKKRFNPGERVKRPLLNLGKLAYFKYDLNEIMDRSKMEDKFVGSFKASIIAKSSKMSIQEAKDYIREVEARKEITTDVSMVLCRLLDRYTIYR